MIQTIPPATWDGYQQITPEMLNRNILAAKAQLEEQARNRWRAWDVLVAPTSNVYICQLPMTGKFDYIIDRISMSGTYSGQPVLSWWASGDTQSFTFPADGFQGEEYNNTLFAGELMDGYTSPSIYGPFHALFELFSTVALPNMQFTISCRSVRPYLNDSITLPEITLYKDDDVLTATRFQSAIDTISTFATQIDPGTRNPPYITRVCFEDFSSATPLILTTDRLPGSRVLNTTRWNQILAKIETVGDPSPGQTLTLEWGRSDTFSGSTVIDLTTTDEYYADINFSDFSRSPSTTGDDFLVRVSTTAGATIARCQIYVVSYESTS
jgi:hypothetical protein